MGVYRDQIRHYEKRVRLNEEMLDAYASGLLDLSRVSEKTIKTIKAANMSMRNAIVAFKTKEEMAYRSEFAIMHYAEDR